MSESAAFNLACEELEASTALDRLEARGTVRLSLKQAGLEARTVAPEQMGVVVARILPEELAARGIDDAERICNRLAERLSDIADDDSEETPDTVFARLGGRS